MNVLDLSDGQKGGRRRLNLRNQRESKRESKNAKYKSKEGGKRDRMRKGERARANWTRPSEKGQTN